MGILGEAIASEKKDSIISEKRLELKENIGSGRPLSPRLNRTVCTGGEALSAQKFPVSSGDVATVNLGRARWFVPCRHFQQSRHTRYFISKN